MPHGGGAPAFGCLLHKTAKFQFFSPIVSLTFPRFPMRSFSPVVARVAALETECQQHRVEVAALTQENSSLRAELADAAEQLARQSTSTNGGQPQHGAGGAMSLLRDENDILSQQVGVAYGGSDGGGGGGGGQSGKPPTPPKPGWRGVDPAQKRGVLCF
jgi:hypothetical protein